MWSLECVQAHECMAVHWPLYVTNVQWSRSTMWPCGGIGPVSSPTQLVGHCHPRCKPDVAETGEIMRAWTRRAEACRAEVDTGLGYPPRKQI